MKNRLMKLISYCYLILGIFLIVSNLGGITGFAVLENINVLGNLGFYLGLVFVAIGLLIGVATIGPVDRNRLKVDGLMKLLNDTTGSTKLPTFENIDDGIKHTKPYQPFLVENKTTGGYHLFAYSHDKEEARQIGYHLLQNKDSKHPRKLYRIVGLEKDDHLKRPLYRSTSIGTMQEVLSSLLKRLKTQQEELRSTQKIIQRKQAVGLGTYRKPRIVVGGYVAGEKPGQISEKYEMLDNHFEREMHFDPPHIYGPEENESNQEISDEKKKDKKKKDEKKKDEPLNVPYEHYNVTFNNGGPTNNLHLLIVKK